MTHRRLVQQEEAQAKAYLPWNSSSNALNEMELADEIDMLEIFDRESREDHPVDWKRKASEQDVQVEGQMSWDSSSHAGHEMNSRDDDIDNMLDSPFGELRKDNTSLKRKRKGSEPYPHAKHHHRTDSQPTTPDHHPPPPAHPPPPTTKPIIPSSSSRNQQTTCKSLDPRLYTKHPVNCGCNFLLPPPPPPPSTPIHPTTTTTTPTTSSSSHHHLNPPSSNLPNSPLHHSSNSLKPSDESIESHADALPSGRTRESAPGFDFGIEYAAPRLARGYAPYDIEGWKRGGKERKGKERKSEGKGGRGVSRGVEE